MGAPMTSDWAGQMAALFDEAEAATPGTERAAVLCQIADIQDRRLGDPAAALSVLQAALRAAPRRSPGRPGPRARGDGPMGGSRRGLAAPRGPFSRRQRPADRGPVSAGGAAGRRPWRPACGGGTAVAGSHVACGGGAPAQL